ncbi:hypothetical protein GGI08_001618, partial [Coemansia sp. S2]
HSGPAPQGHKERCLHISRIWHRKQEDIVIGDRIDVARVAFRRRQHYQGVLAFCALAYFSCIRPSLPTLAEVDVPAAHATARTLMMLLPRVLLLWWLQVLFTRRSNLPSDMRPSTKHSCNGSS